MLCQTEYTFSSHHNYTLSYPLTLIFFNIGWETKMVGSPSSHPIGGMMLSRGWIAFSPNTSPQITEYIRNVFIENNYSEQKHIFSFTTIYKKPIYGLKSLSEVNTFGL